MTRMPVLMWLALGACGGSPAPTADPVPVADGREPTAASDADADARSPTTDSDSDSNTDSRSPTTDSNTDSRSPTTDTRTPDSDPPTPDSDPPTPDDSLVPERSIGVGIFAVDGCPATEPALAPPRIRSEPFPSGAYFSILRRVIRRDAQAELRACYVGSEAHRACRNVTANIVLHVTAAGDVDQVAAAATEPALARCVEASLRGRSLPEPDGGGGFELRFPLRLRVHPE